MSAANCRITAGPISGAAQVDFRGRHRRADGVPPGAPCRSSAAIAGVPGGRGRCADQHRPYWVIAQKLGICSAGDHGGVAMTEADLIIFDCDGVLVDSELLSCRCLSDALASHGIELGVDEALERFVGRSIGAVREHYEALGQRLPDNFAAELKARVRESFAASLLPIEGVGAVLGRLRLPTCVASSSDLDRVVFSLAMTGLSGHFAGRLYTSQMVKRGKPAPDLFLHAAAAMAVDPRRTLVIEDSVSGVRAGKAAGMTVWGFIGGGHYASRDGRAILQAAGADRVFARMSDFWPEGKGWDEVDGRAG
jgi:HAD superfamily hydrolase (TIGR01509 family)